MNKDLNDVQKLEIDHSVPMMRLRRKKFFFIKHLQCQHNVVLVNNNHDNKILRTEIEVNNDKNKNKEEKKRMC